MSRRNTTHLSRLARLVARDADLTYTQALRLAQDAQAAHALPHTLDDAGMTEAARRLVHSARTGQPLSAVPTQVSLGVADDGTRVYLDPSSFTRHTAILGQPGAGKSFALPAVIQPALAAGWPVVLVSTDGPADAAAVDLTRQAAVAQGAPFAAVTALGDITLDTPGVTYVPVGGLGTTTSLSADAILERVLTLMRDRFAVPGTRPATPTMLVLDRSDDLNGDLLISLMQRARSAGIAVVLTSASPWNRLALDGGRALVWEDLMANVGMLITFRVNGMDTAARVAALIAPGDGDVAQAVHDLTIGRAYVAIDRHGPRGDAPAWSGVVSVIRADLPGGGGARR